MLAVLLSCLVAQSPDAGGPVPSPPPMEPEEVAPAPFSLASAGAEQAVVVVTDRWASVIGQLKRYERVGAKWMQVGGAIEVVVGAEGLGWGLGLHPLGVAGGDGPRKTEGDGRGPAGVFALPTAFGSAAPAMKTTMPWLMTSDALACVDDPRSRRYNRLVDTSDASAPADWRTAEKMRSEDGLYDVGVLVDHNALGDGAQQPVVGRGSCVFLHIWKKKGKGTEGCTAMPRHDLEKVIEWLDPAKKPVLVQLPREELVQRRIPWGLP